MQRILPMLLVAGLLFPGSLVGAAEPQSENEFVMKTAPFKPSDYVGVRMHRTTGKAWLVKSGNWQPVPETEAPPKGRYELQLVSSGHADQASWYGFRINLDTGKTWRIVSGKWQLMQTLADE